MYAFVLIRVDEVAPVVVETPVAEVAPVVVETAVAEVAPEVIAEAPAAEEGTVKE